MRTGTPHARSSRPRPGSTRAAARRAPRRGRRARAGRCRATRRRRRRRRRRPPPRRAVELPDADRGGVGLCVLGDVRQRLADDEVGGELDLLRQAAGSSQSTVVGSGARVASASSAARSPCSSTAGWMPRASSRSSESEWASSSLAVVTSSCADGSSPTRFWSSRSCSAIPTRRCCAPSCRLRSSRRRSASPAATIRSREALISASWAPVSASRRCVVDRDRGRRRDRLDQLGIVVERRVVDERAERAAVALDAGHRSLAAGLHHHRRAVGADVAAGVRAPVGDREIGIAERAGECGAQLVRARAAELRNRSASAAARQAGAQLPHQERDRHRQQRQRGHPQQRLRALPGHEVVGEQRAEHEHRERAGDAGQQRPPPRRRGPPPADRDHRHRRGQRREQQGALRAVEYVRDVLVGERQQQVVALELGEQQPDDLQQHERHGVGDQQPWFDARAHPTAREQGQQQRHVEEDPHVDQEVPGGEGERAVDLAQQRRDEEREAGRGHQHARVAVRALVPGEQPGDRERPADEPEDDVDAGDRHLGVDHQRAEHEHFADQRDGQQDGEEDEAVAVDLDGRPRGDRGLAVPCHSERRSQDQSRLLTGPWLRRL